MTIERPTEEQVDRRQEILNNIYRKFESFPATDIKLDLNDESDLGTIMFSYHFPEGTTTPEFSDQLSAKRHVKTGELVIFYAKGKNAGRITLVKNSDTNSVELKDFLVFQKESHDTTGASFSNNESATRPHFHAIESLVAEAEVRMDAEPEHFKTEREKEKQLKKQRKLLQLYAIILARTAKIEAIRRSEDKKKSPKRSNNGLRRLKV